MKQFFLAFLIALAVGGSYASAGAFLAGDVDGDGAANAQDALLILQADAGLGYELVRGGDLETLLAFDSTFALPPVLTLTRQECSAFDDWCLEPMHAGVYRNNFNEMMVRDRGADTLSTMLHELCHGHQYVVLAGDTNIANWPATEEGRSFAAAVERDQGQWMTLIRENNIQPVPWELYANLCSAWFIRPAGLKAIAPEIYAWFGETY